MRAVVFEGGGRVGLRSVAEPATSRRALVKVELAGICGTDAKIVQGSVDVCTPRILGHEIVGRVLRSGDEGPRSGSRVLVDPSESCGRCYTCRRARTHLCPSGGLMGRDQDGGLAELVSVEPSRLHVVAEHVGRDDAALLQVLGTCVHAARMVETFPSDVAVVVGLGVAGLLHVQLLRARGVGLVIGVSGSDTRRERALSFGASAAASPAEASAVVGEITGGAGADLVVEAAGNEPSLAIAVRLAGLGAVVLSFGTLSSGGAGLPYFEMYHKELRLFHPRAAAPSDYDDAIRLVESGAVRASGIVSPPRSLEEAPAALAEWPGEPTRLKLVFEP